MEISGSERLNVWLQGGTATLHGGASAHFANVMEISLLDYAIVVAMFYPLGTINISSKCHGSSPRSKFSSGQS